MSEGVRKRGRPAHAPTEASRALVAGMVAADRSVADIAAALNLSAPTLRAHYVHELSAPRPQITFSFAESGEPGHRRPRRGPERAGRPEHVPTDESREMGEVLVAGSMRQWQIAAALGISVPTLVQHYETELEHGRSRKTAKVLMALFKSATEGANVTAQKAWLAQPNGLEDPPEKPARPVAPAGKKEQAIASAITAARGTDWDNLLPN